MSDQYKTEPDQSATYSNQTPAKPLFIRLAALLELVLAAMLILGRFPVPFANTVALCILASISLWLRGSGWVQIGIRRPRSWIRTLALGVAIGASAQAFDLMIMTPLLARLSGHPPDVSLFRSLIGNVPQLMFWLAVSWSFAAFGEEMAYRGYLLNRVADLAGRNALGWTIAALVSSALFALGHGYQGWTGMIDVGFSALVPVVAYLATGRNLWVPILIHGTGDSIGFILMFFHRDPGI